MNALRGYLVMLAGMTLFPVVCAYVGYLRYVQNPPPRHYTMVQRMENGYTCMKYVQNDLLGRPRLHLLAVNSDSGQVLLDPEDAPKGEVVLTDDEWDFICTGPTVAVLK